MMFKGGKRKEAGQESQQNRVVPSQEREAGDPITDFALDRDRLAIIAECTQNYDVGDDDYPDAEWSNNMLSCRTVVYGSGRIAKIGEEVSHAVDPEELELCRGLSSEVAALMAGTEVGMGSEGSCEFKSFFVAGNVGDAVPDAMGEVLIRERFGGTIFPPAEVKVEPLAEEGFWWSAVLTDGEEMGDEYLVPWRRMVAWFEGRSEFKDIAFVCIEPSNGFFEPDGSPKGTVMEGSVLPRLALGLTYGGSLVGLFGWTVHT